jgi:hypothetical protein
VVQAAPHPARRATFSHQEGREKANTISLLPFLPTGEGARRVPQSKAIARDEGPRAASPHRKIPRRIAVAFHAQASSGHEVFEDLGDALFAGGGVAAFEAEAESLGRDGGGRRHDQFADGQQLVEGKDEKVENTRISALLGFSID